MYFADHLSLDAPKRTKDGFLAVRAKASRTGVYQYTGREVDPANVHGLRDQAVVNVLRDDATVFDASAVRSFIGKPVTNDHPSVPVTAANWRDYARGTIMGALRDGDYLAFDILLTDKAAISALDAGKRELSNGYSAELEFGDFKAPDGTVCPVRQSKITDGNHVALVDQGRAGPDCRIADSARWAACDANPAALADLKEKKVPKTITHDGLPISLGDEAAVEALIAKLTDKAAAAEIKLTDAQTAHDKAMAAKDAAIDDLKSKVIDQTQIDALADAKAAVVADAKKLIGDKLGDTAGKSVADVRRMALVAKLGDAAITGKSDDYVSARFDAALETVSDGKSVVHNISPAVNVGDAAAKEAAALASANDHNAWRKQA